MFNGIRNIKRASLYHKTGISFFEARDYKDAILYLKQAVTYNKYDGKYYNDLGAAYDREGNINKALLNYRQALILTKNDPMVYDNLGNAEEQLNDHNDSLGHIQRAIQLNPSNSKYYLDLEYVEYDLHHYSECLQILNQGLQIDPNNSAFYNKIGVVYLNLQKFNLAYDYFKRAVSLNVNNDLYHENLGEACVCKNNYNEAIREFKQAINLNPNESRYYHDLGVTYLKLENYSAALPELSHATSLDNSNYVYINDLAMCEGKLCKYSNAVNDLERAYSLNPNSVVIQQNLRSAKEFINKYGINVNSNNQQINDNNTPNVLNTHGINNIDSVNNVNNNSNNNITRNKKSNSINYDKQVDYLKKLDSLVGLTTVKHQIRTYINRIRVNKIRTGRDDHGEIHLIFEGNPGTGKTTVGKLLCKILYQKGIIKSKNYVSINATQLQGAAPGMSANKVKAVMHKAINGVLFIDEAYTLAHKSVNSQAADEAVAELISEVEDHRNDIVVIMAGYTQEMEDFLNNSNPGLSSRFPDRIYFPDYSNKECQDIFKYDLKKDNMHISDTKLTNKVLVYDLNKYISLRKSDSKHKFANARTVRNIYDEIKDKFTDRLGELSDDQLEQLKGTNKLNTITLDDIKKAFKVHGISYQSKDDSSALTKLDNLVGLNNVKDKIKEYINTTKINHLINSNEQQEIHLIFEGNPGTGKTTVARLFAKALYERGVIRNYNVVEVEGSDLMGQYVGQTKTQTRKIVQKALGGTLFIDEAYTLAHTNDGSNNSFADEAVAELIADAENHRNDLVVIMAGYTKEMEDFLNTSNPGLASRFPTRILFPDYSNKECFEILLHMLKKENLHLYSDAKPVLSNDINTAVSLNRAKSGSRFGNARYIRNICDKIIQVKNDRLAKIPNNTLISLKNNDPSRLLTITLSDVENTFNNIINSNSDNTNNIINNINNINDYIKGLRGNNYKNN